MRGAWNTDDELLYIDEIGTSHEACRNIPKKTLLQKYLRSLYKRVDWGNLDRKRILTYLVRKIKATK